MRLGAAAVLVLLTGCASQSPSGPGPVNCAGIEKFFQQDLASYQARVDGVYRQYSDMYWKVETAHPQRNPEKLSALFTQLQEKGYDIPLLEKTRALVKASTQLSEACAFRPRLERVLALFEASMLSDSKVIQAEKHNDDLQEALSAKSNGLRVSLPDEKEPVSLALYKKRLSSTANRAEREALYHQFQVLRAKQWLSWGFLDLVRSRNEEARLAGYPNYYEYRFFRNKLDVQNFRTLTAQLKTKLAPKVSRLIRGWGRKFKISKVQAWDFPYLREQSASGEINALLAPLSENAPLELARLFYQGLGIDIDSYHFLTDLFPREGKNTHAFAMNVVMPHLDATGKVLPEPKPDIRFLANLKRPVVWTDISTVIHELGHAVHMAQVRQPFTVFLDVGSVDTEAIAMTLERMADSAEFMKEAFQGRIQISPKKQEALLREHAQRIREGAAVNLIRQAFFSDFEYALYRDPSVDLGKLWSQLHKEYFGFEVAPEEAGWDVDHFLSSPVYIQNYVIGMVMVEQLYTSILHDFKTSYHSVALGEKIKKVYLAPGTELNYLQYVERFTGKPLSAQDALKLLR